MLRVLRRPQDLVNRYYPYLYLAVFFLAAHYALTAYINSIYLNQFYSTGMIDVFYAVGSVLTLLVLVIISKIFKRTGVIAALLTGIAVEAIALVGMAFVRSPALIFVFFIFHQALPPILLFSLDIILEGSIHSEGVTGRIRSVYLTILNTAFLIAPFIATALIFYRSFQNVYLWSLASLLIFACVTIEALWRIKLRKPKEIEFGSSLKHFIGQKDLLRIFSLNFLLQAFYALMVIYVPIYLRTVIGFGWPQIGLLFTIMLVPFVIFEAPLGRLFDSFQIERDTLMIGFILMAGSTFLMAASHSSSMLIWACLLFISRIGASFVEVSSEYAFFSRVNEQHAEFIGIFRMTEPAAYVLAPLLAGLVTLAAPTASVFEVIAVLALVGLVISYHLVTRRRVNINSHA